MQITSIKQNPARHGLYTDALPVSLYLQMCYFREWSLTGQPTNIADDEH